MNKGPLHLIKTILTGIKIGKRLSDKIAILKILTKHVLVNRGLAKFSGTLHKPINCIFKGFPFALYLRDNGTDAHIFFEVFIQEQYKNISSYHPKVIYDLGANIGITSLYFACSFPEAKIYGFEPMPENYEIARLNYQSISNSSLYKLAVGDENKDSVLIIDSSNSGAHKIKSAEDTESVNQIPVKVKRIDTLIKELKIPEPDFLKIDTEGSEYAILTGVDEFSPFIHYVCMETHDPELHRNCKNWLIINDMDIYLENTFSTQQSTGFLVAVKNNDSVKNQ